MSFVHNGLGSTLLLSCVGLVFPRQACFLLCGLRGNLDADRYIALLERHVIDYIEDDWLFHQDNVPAHVSERTKAFFSANGAQLLRWMPRTAQT